MNGGGERKKRRDMPHQEEEEKNGSIAYKWSQHESTHTHTKSHPFRITALLRLASLLLVPYFSCS